MAGIPGPRIDATQLAALVVQTLLNGVFLVLWVQCMDSLVKRSQQQSERLFKPLSFIAILLLLTIIGHWMLDCARAFEAFVFAQDHSDCHATSCPNAATIVYSDNSDPKFVANSALYVVTTLAGDSFMVYRLFIVWSRNWWIIILPLSLIVGLAVTGSVTTYHFSQATPIFGAASGWITASFVMTLLANLSSTSLIALRIWMTSRRLNLQSSRMPKVVEIVVESAALYSCCLLITLVSYASHSNIQFVGVSVNSPMVGIIFCMIISRTHHLSSEHLSSASHDTSGAIRHKSHQKFRSNQYQMNKLQSPLAIKVTTEVDDPVHGQSTPKVSDFPSMYLIPDKI
ncbi:hypothetical protein PILCRDRAFT_814747 [Piloderma croceum F 1598]|uniref:Transmembrane protein n=1 Tax=Piloderma croceum (strain F 1598) TaxID=765440 RepID=A0A0C3GBQ3_PILCF|nr:hypothetical protein PILCRDRAFT_814747 [Piloderma croceum F 1598]